MAKKGKNMSTDKRLTSPTQTDTESHLPAKSRRDQDPVAVYLAGLSPSSRRTMRQALDTIARLGLGKETVTARSVPWAQLRFQHTQALRSALAERYAHSTANCQITPVNVPVINGHSDPPVHGQDVPPVFNSCSISDKAVSAN